MLKSKWAFEVSQIIHWTLSSPILIVQDLLTEGYPQSNVKSVKIAAIFRIYRTGILSSLRLFFCLWSGSENPRVIGSIPIGGIISCVFFAKNTHPAAVAHLVERHLAKVEVASSSLVGRSRQTARNRFTPAFCLLWWRGQVVRQGSAKPWFPGSNPGVTSRKTTTSKRCGCFFV